MKANVLQDILYLHQCTFKFYIGSDVSFNKDNHYLFLLYCLLTDYFSYFMSSCTGKIVVFNNFSSLIFSQPRDKQNRPRDFLLFKYFLENLLLTIFKQKRSQSSSNYCNKKLLTHYQKKRRHGFGQQPFRNVFPKFKVDYLSCFCTGAHQVFTISLTLKTESKYLKSSRVFPFFISFFC